MFSDELSQIAKSMKGETPDYQAIHTFLGPTLDTRSGGFVAPTWDGPDQAGGGQVFDIADGAVGAIQLGAQLQPVRNVPGPSNPTLPDAAYPIDSLIYNKTDKHLYKTTDGTSWTDFGDSTLIVGQIQAAQIATDAIDFRTLGPSATDLIASHVPNHSFFDAIAGALTLGTSRDDAAGHTAHCPYWTAWRSSGSGTATVVDSSSWPGGHYIESKYSAAGTATTNNVGLTTDAVPVVPGWQVTLSTVRGVNVPSGVTLTVGRRLLFYDAAGSYISDDVQTVATAGEPTAFGPSLFTCNPVLVPLTARYLRVEIMSYESSGHDSATYARLGAVGLLFEFVNASYLGLLTAAVGVHVKAGDIITDSGSVTATGGPVTGSSMQTTAVIASGTAPASTPIGLTICAVTDAGWPGAAGLCVNFRADANAVLQMFVTSYTGSGPFFRHRDDTGGWTSWSGPYG